MAGKRSKQTRGAKSTGRTGRRQAARKPRRREIGAVVCAAFALLTILACFGVQSIVTDLARRLGMGLIGSGFYILPVSLLIAFVILVTHDGRPVALRVSCALLLCVTIGALVHLFAATGEPEWSFVPMLRSLYLTGVEGTTGGLISGLIAMVLNVAISKIGAVLVLLAALILELLTSLNMTVLGIVRAIQQRPRLEYDAPQKEHPDPAKTIIDRVSTRHIQREQERRAVSPKEFDLPVDDPIFPISAPAEKAHPTPERKPVKSPDQLLLEQREEQRRKNLGTEESPAAPPTEPELPPLTEEPKKLKREEVARETAQVAQEIAENQEAQIPAYQFPPLELLRSGDGKSVDGTEEMRLNTARLNDTLASFGIDAHIINVVRGPSVTRYELELDRGVKLSKITSLADDIALSLGASGVRISAIPDKISVVGVEVPNKLVTSVLLRDVISSEPFQKNKSPISFAVGKDIGGASIVGDIAKLPHMLIAGTTGSGKSVCMNSLIVSLLYKASPEQVRLIMIDPKMVELGVYSGIPHLLIPVVTDPKKAAGSLQWAVTEMMRRYRMMASAGVRELDSYNQTAAHNDELETMPQIVVVIDELADLMLVAAKEVEESICRIAQMGRAAGIHLVIATQRPSADVITGLMKANIPSRIAFAVASAMESRIILDAQGAEKLVGKGDMLYAPLGQGKPKRVQGCFVSDDEVRKVAEFIAKDATANYDHNVMEEIEKHASQDKKSAPEAAEDTPAAGGDHDELLPQAVEIILETKQASVSMLQRRLKLGYARAARIVDEMEELGIVGPFSGSKPRELLITKEEWEQRMNSEGNPPVEEEIP